MFLCFHASQWLALSCFPCLSDYHGSELLPADWKCYAHALLSVLMSFLAFAWILGCKFLSLLVTPLYLHHSHVRCSRLNNFLFIVHSVRSLLNIDLNTLSWIPERLILNAHIHTERPPCEPSSEAVPKILPLLSQLRGSLFTTTTTGRTDPRQRQISLNSLTHVFRERRQKPSAKSST